MATILNHKLAGHTTSSRWGSLTFDDKGACQVSDEVGKLILEAGIKDFTVLGLPIVDPENDDLDSEKLDEDELAAAGDDGEEGEEEEEGEAAEGEEAAEGTSEELGDVKKPAKKKTKKKSRR